MSNLKFKHTVNSYAEAHELWVEGNRDLAYNTVLRRRGDDYQVVHHDTAIITFHPDGSCTIDAAWVSATTANRMQKCKPEMVERINRRSFQNGEYVGRYEVTLANHPGVIDMWEGTRYRIFPDRTVVKV